MKKKLGMTRFQMLTIRAHTPQKPDFKMINLYLNDLGKVKRF